jgi:hypothetical protein
VRRAVWLPIVAVAAVLATAIVLAAAPISFSDSVTNHQVFTAAPAPTTTTTTAPTTTTTAPTTTTTAGAPKLKAQTLQTTTSNVPLRDKYMTVNIQVVNTGTGPAPAPFSARYWFNNDVLGDVGQIPPDVECLANCANVTIQVVKGPVFPASAEYYLQLTFGAPLPAGATVGPVQVRLVHSTVSWSLLNDYSRADQPGPVDNTTVAVYRGSTLVWGNEP